MRICMDTPNWLVGWLLAFKMCINVPFTFRFFFFSSLLHRVMMTENPSTQAAQDPDTPQTL